MAVVTDSFMREPVSKALHGWHIDPRRIAFGLLSRQLERARSRAALLELDDRILADIGLDRAAARAEGAKGLWS